MKRSLRLLVLFAVLFANGCDQSSKSPLVRIATNPWPGYELLFVADKLGYFKQEGLNIKLLQLASLVDVQRTYNQGRADGITSTVIEAINVAVLNEEKISIVLIPDYSFGGDMIISNKRFNNITDLKGKRVGVETGSLGIIILEKALSKNGLSMSDIEYVNLEQLKMNDKLTTSAVDAVVTYPPFSTEILRNKKYKTIFTTREIPEEIIDVIAVRDEVLQKDPKWVNKFHKAWFKALDYLKNNRASAVQIMADREGLSVEEFTAALGDLYLLNKSEIKNALEQDSIKSNIKSICNTLVELKSLEFDCKRIDKFVTVVRM